ncbi:hypothetical protein F4780DRAFT_636398 [Xylariomycetidae sp. FL0641]|nr:hypothetical protein F4780DRAFT_636398 [Xylariomycetidae sp. FL0641]
MAPSFLSVPSKRTLRRKQPSSDSLSTMSSTTSNSTSGSRPTSRSYDTGFPDSFSDFTTSARHPDAVVDPEYAISAEDVDPSKTMHRHRHSFLHKRQSHKRTISHGIIPKQGSYNNSIDSAIELGLAESLKGLNSTDNVAGSGEHIEISVDDEMFSAADVAAIEEADNQDERRKSKLFRKWRSEKN